MTSVAMDIDSPQIIEREEARPEDVKHYGRRPAPEPPVDVSSDENGNDLPEEDVRGYRF